MRSILKDPFSGRVVELRTAELHQTCPICSQQMVGRIIFRVEGRPASWRCADHLEDVLMVVDMLEGEGP